MEEALDSISRRGKKIVSPKEREESFTLYAVAFPLWFSHCMGKEPEDSYDTVLTVIPAHASPGDVMTFEGILALLLLVAFVVTLIFAYAFWADFLNYKKHLQVQDNQPSETQVESEGDRA